MHKGFFKALFINTCHGASLRRMSHSKAIPDGLKLQECQRNASWSKPSIQHIPEKDVIQEALDGRTDTMKLTLPYKAELHVQVWLKGTPEHFLVHIQQALHAIRQKCLIVAYKKACQEWEGCE